MSEQFTTEEDPAVLTVADIVLSLAVRDAPSPMLMGQPIVTTALAVLGAGPVGWASAAARACTHILLREGAPLFGLPALSVRCGAEAVFLDVLIELSGAPSRADLARPVHRAVVQEIAARDLQMPVVVDALRYAQQFFIARMLEAATAAGAGWPLATALTIALSRSMDRFVDGQTADHATVVADLRRSGGGVRPQLVEAMIGGGDVDADIVRIRLGIDLSRPCVACIVRPHGYRTFSADAANRAAGVVVAAFGVHPDVRLERANGDVWMWFGPAARGRPPIDPERIADAFVAIGSPQLGADGFRRTFIEASDALDVAELHTHDRVTHAEDVALVSLLSRDVERGRWFLDATLGHLNGPEADMHELRETLLRYFAAGQRLVDAAALLHVHRNTLVHRLDRIAELLGHPISGYGPELHTAVVLREALGPPDQH